MSVPRIALATRVALAVLLFATATVAGAAESRVNKTFLGGLALDGYDPVAYFEEGRPVPGSKAFTHAWSGATWRFASAAHRDAFAAAPERYAPQYGGFCAWAVAHGYTADVDPEAWKIVEGRLYLNCDKEVQAKWEADVPGHIQRADANWPALAAKK